MNETTKTAIIKHIKQFHDHGDHYCFSTRREGDQPSDHLPAGVYNLEVESHPMTGTKLKFVRHADRYSLPEKRFGARNRHLARVRADYDITNPALGVLLKGLKGSGKSMFAEELGNHIVGMGLPVLQIEQAFDLDILRVALSMIGPCMLYFDEFGKIYQEEESRAKLLALFSDSTLNGVLFVITGNSDEEFTDALMNRPGRFRYRLHFKGLTVDDVVEVAEHYHVPQQLHMGLIRYVAKNVISYDMLITVCTLIREFKNEEEVREYLSILNVPEWEYPNLHVTAVRFDGKLQAVAQVNWQDGELSFNLMEGEECDIARPITMPLNETVEYYRNTENTPSSGQTHTDPISGVVVHYHFALSPSFEGRKGSQSPGVSASHILSVRKRESATAEGG